MPVELAHLLEADAEVWARLSLSVRSFKPVKIACPILYLIRRVVYAELLQPQGSRKAPESKPS